MKTHIVGFSYLRHPLSPLFAVLFFAGGAEASPTSSTTLSGYVDTSAMWNMPQPNNRQFITPDFITRSAYTLPPGSVYVDVGGFYSYKQRTDFGVERTYESVGGTLELGVGLLKNLDAKIWLPGRYNFLTVKDPTGQDSAERGGVGNLATSLEYNFFGNNRYPTAGSPSGCGGVHSLSLAANMMWPTASSDYSWSDRGNNYEGGLSLQYGYRTACGAELRINSGFTLSDNYCWESCFDNRLSITKSLFTPKFFVTAGIQTEVSTSRRSEWRGMADVGFIYYFKPNWSAYVGSGFGLTDNANDFVPTLHMAYNF